MGGALLAIAVTIALGLRPRRIAVLISLFVLIAAGALAIAGVVAGDSRIVHTEADNTAHFQQLQDDLDLLSQYPLGVGLGRIDFLGQRFHVGGKENQPLGQSTESALFNRGIEGGVAALASYLILFFVAGMRLRRARLLALDRSDLLGIAVPAAGIGSLLGYCVAGLNLPVPATPTMWGTIGLGLLLLPPPPASAPARCQPRARERLSRAISPTRITRKQASRAPMPPTMRLRERLRVSWRIPGPAVVSWVTMGGTELSVLANSCWSVTTACFWASR
jgi:hypothetical protein